MIYVFENSNNNSVSVVYDDSTLTQLQKTEGIAIEELPIKEEIKGKIAVLKCKKSTGDVWYEYEDIPKSKEGIQQESMESLAQTIAKLNLENKKKDAVVTTLAQTVATLNLRINQLEKEGI